MKKKYVYKKQFFKVMGYDPHYLTPDLQALLLDPDQAFKDKHAVILKHDLGSDLVKIGCDHHYYVVKRYNLKSIWHACRRAFRPTRAMRNWINAHQLAKLNITTATPIAFIENRIGFLRFRSYYIMDYVSDPTVCDLDKHPNDTIKEVINQVDLLLTTLHEHGYVHGDMKCTNILFSAERGITLLDLDGMHKPYFFKQRKFNKDRARFKKNWQ